MLHDLPPLGRRSSPTDFILMNGIQNEETPSHQDPLDDVFGSAPSSPTLDSDFSGAQRAEYSDIPRLRSTHVTNGYRDGIAVSKEKYIQEGFDEGFSLGAEVGRRVGWTLGVLEGLCNAERKLKRLGEAGRLLEQAKEELKVELVLGREFFGLDGIWTYDAAGQDIEGEVTFKDVAEAHPVLKKWKETVLGLAERYGGELQ